MPLSLILAAALLTGAQAADDSGEAIVQRTKTMTGTYASYAWLYQRNEEGEQIDAWSAEFHNGDWHRAEGADIRTLANCRTHEGWVYTVKTGDLVEDDQVWIGACGIFTGNQITAIDRLPDADGGAWGTLRMVRVTDRQFVRTYAIDARDIIIRGNWVKANGSPSPCIQMEPIAILGKVPSGTWFAPDSLKRSAVVERYRTRPAAPAPLALSGKSCG